MEKPEETDLKSQLPETLPLFEVEYSSGSHHAGAFENVKISRRILTYEETRLGKVLVSWSAKISRGEQKRLYQVFLENNFDLIRTISENVQVFDGSNSSIILKINNDKFFHVSTSGNCRVSDVSLENYHAIYKEITNLVSKHQGNNSAFGKNVYGFPKPKPNFYRQFLDKIKKIFKE